MPKLTIFADCRREVNFERQRVAVNLYSAIAEVERSTTVALLAQTFVRVLIGSYLGLISRLHCQRHGVHANVSGPHGKD